MQAALKLVLEPIFEADFKPVSYGFRGRRAHDAIAEIHQFTSRGYEWVSKVTSRRASTRSITRPLWTGCEIGSETSASCVW